MIHFDDHIFQMGWGTNHQLGNEFHGRKKTKKTHTKQLQCLLSVAKVSDVVWCPKVQVSYSLVKFLSSFALFVKFQPNKIPKETPIRDVTMLQASWFDKRDGDRVRCINIRLAFKPMGSAGLDQQLWRWNRGLLDHQYEQWKKGPWLFTKYKGLYYPVMWGL